MTYVKPACGWILVVDCERGIESLLAGLKGAPHVLRARNGPDAREFLSLAGDAPLAVIANEPQLDMSASEFVAAARHDAQRTNLPLIVLTCDGFIECFATEDQKAFRLWFSGVALKRVVTNFLGAARQ